MSKVSTCTLRLGSPPSPGEIVVSQARPSVNLQTSGLIKLFKASKPITYV